MPRFMVLHYSPGVSLDDFRNSVPAVLEGRHATFVKSYTNLTDGMIVNIYEGESAEEVERELERIGFPIEDIKEIQFEGTADDLRAWVGQ